MEIQDEDVPSEYFHFHPVVGHKNTVSEGEERAQISTSPEQECSDASCSDLQPAIVKSCLGKLSNWTYVAVHKGQISDRLVRANVPIDASVRPLIHKKGQMVVNDLREGTLVGVLERTKLRQLRQLLLDAGQFRNDGLLLFLARYLIHSGGKFCFARDECFLLRHLLEDAGKVGTLLGGDLGSGGV